MAAVEKTKKVIPLRGSHASRSCAHVRSAGRNAQHEMQTRRALLQLWPRRLLEVQGSRDSKARWWPVPQASRKAGPLSGR